MEGDAASNDPAAGTAAAVSDATTPLVPTSEAPLREDQIQNAVAFLSHTKVQGSPAAAKRTFLEKKGLTAAEIDEAFKRVPGAPAAALGPVVSAPATTSTPSLGANNLVTYTQQPPYAAQHSHVVAQAPPAAAGAIVPAGHMQQQQLQQLQPQPMRWTQVVLGLGVAAAGLYGLHQLLHPHITSWSKQLTASRRAAKEAKEAKTAALTAALNRLAEGQAQLQETLKGLAATIHQQQQGTQCRSKQQGYALGYENARLETDYHRPRSPERGQHRQQQQYQQQQQHPSSVSGLNSVDSYSHDSSRGAMASCWDPYDSQTARPPAVGGPSSYAIGGMGHQSDMGLQEAAASSRGGLGLGGSPPDGYEVVPRSPGQADTYSSTVAVSSTRGYAGPGGGAQAGTAPGGMSQASPAVGGAADSSVEQAPHSAAFHEVMEMVRQGITPPNVRTDINDLPPDSSRPITAPQLQPKGKPWERAISNSSSSTSRAYGGPAPVAVSSSSWMGQQRQHQYVEASGGSVAVGAGNMPTKWSLAPTLSNSVIDSMEDAAITKRTAANNFDFSHLLGGEAGRSDAPWRPPPPPAPTMVNRPGSSGGGSSSVRAADSQAATSASQQAAHAPILGPEHSSASRPDVSGSEGIVASIAANAVQNVVAAVEAAQPQAMAAEA